ncbi:MAG: FHA domain-containing protein [Myxococcota bacterium]
MLQLVCRNIEGERQVVPLTSGTLVTVGRNPGCTIQVKNPSVSRQHAEIQEVGGSWVVRDLGSSNHSFVNDAEITESPIAAGDELRFGDFPVKVQLYVGTAEARGGERAAPARERSAPAREEAPAADAGGGDREAARREREERIRRKREERAGGAAEAAPEPAAVPERRPAPEPERPRRPEPEPVRAAPEPARAAPEPARAADPEPAADRGRPRPSSSARPARSAPSRVRPEAAAPAASGGEEVDASELRRAKAATRGMEKELSDAQERVREMEARIVELETREGRFDEELDGWHERYNRVREQLDHGGELLERAREELEERDQLIAEHEGRITSLEGQLAAFEATRGETGGQLSELKAKAVQKDRRIDELQRELDLMEFDLRSAREELEALQDSFNHENTQERRLNRELETLREVIADKENVITELKGEIEEKARENYDLRLGTGIKDLEEARRDVLDSLFAKTKEVDALREQLKAQERETAAVREQVGDLEEKISEQKDISSHPDFQRKVRELERALADLNEARADQEKLGKRLDDFSPEQKGKLEAEINFLQRKNKALQDKLESVQEDMEALEKRAREAKPAPAPVVEATADIDSAVALRAQGSERVAQAMENYAVWKANLNLLRNYLEEAEEAVDDAKACSTALESVNELVTLVLSDAGELRKELVGLKDLLAEG